MKIPESVCHLSRLATDHGRMNTVRLRRVDAATVEATVTNGRVILSARWQDADLVAPDASNPLVDGEALLPRSVLTFLRLAMGEERRVDRDKAHAVLATRSPDGGSIGLSVATVAGAVGVAVDQSGLKEFPACDPIRDAALARPAIDFGSEGALPVLLGVPLLLELMELLDKLECEVVEFSFPLGNPGSLKPIAFRSRSEDGKLQLAGCLMGVLRFEPYVDIDLWGESQQPKREEVAKA